MALLRINCCCGCCCCCCCCCLLLSVPTLQRTLELKNEPKEEGAGGPTEFGPRVGRTRWDLIKVAKYEAGMLWGCCGVENLSGLGLQRDSEEEERERGRGRSEKKMKGEYTQKTGREERNRCSLKEGGMENTTTNEESGQTMERPRKCGKQKTSRTVHVRSRLGGERIGETSRWWKTGRGVMDWRVAVISSSALTTDCSRYHKPSQDLKLTSRTHYYFSCMVVYNVAKMNKNYKIRRWNSF